MTNPDPPYPGPRDPTLEGLEVGGYTLERLLGHGGKGSVWLGHRHDGRFEGQVAVTGPTAGARILESELAALLSDGKPRLTLFAQPLVTAGEWRLARGDFQGADSLARLARDTAAIDSQALTRSALVGRAELLWAEALLAERDLAEARKAARRAMVALGNGYGNGHRWTLAARQLVDSLAR